METDSLPGMYSMAKIVSIAKEQKSLMLSHIASESTAQMDQFEAMLNSQNTKLVEELRNYQKTISTPRDREMFGKITPAHENLMRVWSKIALLSRAANKKDALAMWINEAGPPARESMQVLEELNDLNKSSADSNANAAADASASGRLWIILVLLLAFTSGTAIAFFIVRNTNSGLRSAVEELRTGVDEVTGASGQIATGSQALAQGASQQAASLEETSASTLEMAAMTQKNAANSQQAAALMSVVDQRVSDANTSLEQMVTSMKEINMSSDKISKIIRVIDEIAFQTNILALNAAVEAARAGEAGMGFAVVAEEVRNLAQRSAQAAKDTAALIEESMGRSSDGSAKLAKVGEAIRSITESAQKVKTLVDEVSLSSAEQARGSEQISRAVVQMEQVTQQTAANAEQSAAAAEELSAQSETMKRVIAELTTMVDGVGSKLQAYVPPVRKPTRAGSASKSLTVLSKAVAHKPRNQMTFTSAKVNREAFPLEEKFSEF
jgi:methyl-accepting chemotaxis protein/methyl-accepting chemotaxis protein-1 (serine sensor receptor)